MGSVSVTREDVREEKAREILEGFYAQPVHYGVPTIFLRENLPVSGDVETGELRGILNRLEQSLTEFTQSETFQNIPDMGKDFIKSLNAAEYFRDAVRIKNTKPFMPWQHIVSDTHSPFLSFIYAPKSQGEGAYLAKRVDIPFVPDLPGTPAQSEILDVGHETAHNVLGREPYAEIAAAIQGIKTGVIEPRVLKARADSRAAVACFNFDETLFRGSIKNYNEVYGWPMVDAVDFAAQIPEDKVKVLEDAQIVKALKATSIRHLEERMYNVSYHIYDRDHDAFEKRDFGKLAQIADELVQSGHFKDSKEQYMASRLALAFSRIGQGRDAYTDEPEKNLKFPSMKILPQFDV